MKTCAAAVAHRAHADFSIEQVSVEDPRAGEVLVRIAGVGLCHTDLVARDQVEAFYKPAVLGHEGAGVIEAIGPGVTGLAVGDRVVLGFSSCGQCKHCADHLPSYCESFGALNYAGLRLEDGSTAHTLAGARVSSHFFGQSSFSSLAVTRARNVVKVGDTRVPLELLGPLGCGFQTGAGAIMRSMQCTAGSTLAVFGGGPVGLAAVMAARIVGCSAIILVEPIAARRQIATELGATHVIDPAAAGNLAEAIRALVPRGVDFALDTSGNIAVIEAGLASLAARGLIGLVGVPKDLAASISVNVVALMSPGLRLMGIIEGDSLPQEFIPEILRLQAEGRFPFERLIRSYPLTQINEAVAAQARGDCIKAVLIP
jgi:aryl-alcohol dehydrogenase